MASPQSPANKIESAHQLYRDGKYAAALGFYTEALSLAKTKPQRIALHSNRAACYLKLHSFNKAAEECTSVLELDHDHTGALMLRAQTLVTLKDYHSALFDVNRLLELNPSSEVYQNLETRLRTQLSLASIPESEAELEEEDENDDEDHFCSNEINPEEGEEDEDVGIVKISKTEPVESTVNAKAGLSETENLKQCRDQKSESKKSITAEVIAQAQRKAEPRRTIASEVIAEAQRAKASSEQQSKGWQAIPKPKGHSTLNYGRWDRVEDDSSEEEDEDDDDEESRPQYRFRVRTVGVQPVK